MNFKYFNTKTLISTILVLAVLFRFLSKQIEKTIANNDILLEVFEYLDFASTLGLLSLFLVFLNHWGWQFSIFKWLIDIPNLNGRYTGKLVSSYEGEDGVQVQKDCVIEIRQTASSIHIHAYFGDNGSGSTVSSSNSHSVAEELIQEKDGFYRLYYIFTNESDPLIQLNNHAGTSRFKYYPDIKTLEGEYYNQRRNIGTIKVVFKQKRQLGRLIK